MDFHFSLFSSSLETVGEGWVWRQETAKPREEMQPITEQRFSLHAHKKKRESIGKQ